MTVAAWVGGSVASRRPPMTAEAREDFNLVQTATLTLLGLIIGFTFSMAVGRYDQRKNLEEEEANAIGTAYLRADLIGEPHAAKLQGTLRDYANERLRFYQASRDDGRRDRRAHGRPAERPLVDDSRAGADDATPITAACRREHQRRDQLAGLLAGRMVEPHPARSLDAHDRDGPVRQLLVGPRRQAAQGPNYGCWPYCRLSLAIAFFLIADIDAPRGGVIRVVPQNLQALVKGGVE